MIPENRLRHVEVKIGLLVVIIVLATAVALVYVGYQKDLFAKRISYEVISHTGGRLFRGMPVKIEGFSMGKVSRIELNDEGKIVLTLKILEKYQKWIRSDSRVFFNQESMIGKPYLRFTAGSAEKEVMPEDSVFNLEFEGGIDEIIRRAKPVMEDLGQIVWDIRVAADDFVDPEGSFSLFMTSLENVGHKLDKGEGIVPYIIGSKKGREKLDSIIDGIADIQDNIERLTLDLDNTINSRVNPILDDISKTTRDLYILRRKGEYTLDLSSDLLLKLNNTWPLAPADKKRETPELPLP